MNEYDNNRSISFEKNMISDPFLAPNEKSHETYGAVYSPSDDGKEYKCESYSSVKLESDNIGNERNDVSIKRKNTNRTSAKVGLIIALVAVCILLSGMAAFVASLITRDYFYSHYSFLEGTESVTENEWNDTDRVLVDTSKNPDYTTQIVVPGELMTMEQAIINVKDSVVEITTETVKSGYGGFSQYVVSGAGSGVIISSGGYIVTNNHVIEGASNIKVRLTDGREYDAILVGTDPQTDVAVIEIVSEKGETFQSAVIGTNSSLSLGQTVIAIGNPLGELGGTVTDGIISSLAREVAIDGSGTMTLLQTNAAVSPGNSGGGLFDLYGRLIGVVNAKSTGEGIEGISFAIPIDTAWDVASQLIDKGYVSNRPTIGITLKQVQYGYSVFGETYTFVVVADSNGINGFKDEDIILSIDNREVSTLTEVSEIVSSHIIGDHITVRVRRNKRDYDIDAVIIEYIPKEAEVND